jgi:CheY-like chemotaxis protein
MPHQLSNQSALKGLRILIVEDMGLIAVELQRMIEGLGCITLGPAAKVEEAKKMAENEQLDGVLLDIQLADQVAYPVAEVLRDRKIPFIILSGYDEIYVRRDFQQYPHLQKPFNSEQLVELMADTFVHG